MTMRRAEIQVTKRRYPCGAVAGGPSPLPYNCPEHGPECGMPSAALRARLRELVTRWRFDAEAMAELDQPGVMALRRAAIELEDALLSEGAEAKGRDASCIWCDHVVNGRRAHCPTHGFKAEGAEPTPSADLMRNSPVLKEAYDSLAQVANHQHGQCVECNERVRQVMKALLNTVSPIDTVTADDIAWAKSVAVDQEEEGGS